MARMLDPALMALRQGDGRGGLSRLLDVWRDCLDPAVADLVDELSDAIVDRATPVGGLCERDGTPAWLRRARRRDPAELGQMLRQLDEINGRGLVQPASPCFDELAKRSADPRLSAYSCRILERAPFGGPGAEKIWTCCGRMILASPDYRSLRRCERLIGAASGQRDPTLRRFLTAKLPKLLAELYGASVRRPSVPVGSAEVEEFASAILALTTVDPKLDAAVRRRPSAEDEFIRMMVAHPEDDSVELVYADWLLERGDPRGELLALEHRRRLGGDVAARYRQLLRDHHDALLGPIAPYIRRGSVRFERGIAVAGEVSLSKQSDAVVAAALEQWATFEELSFVGRGFLSAHMRSLRRLRGVAPAMMAELCEHPCAAVLEDLRLAVERREISGYGQGPARARAGLRALCESSSFPRLRSLGVGRLWPEDLRWLWRSHLGDQLEVLRFDQLPDSGYRPFVGLITHGMVPEVVLSGEGGRRVLISRRRGRTAMVCRSHLPSSGELGWLDSLADEIRREFGAAVDARSPGEMICWLNGAAVSDQALALGSHIR